MTKVSNMAANLVGSEIIKLAGEIKAKIAEGQRIHNFTIGDFNPEIFPIPIALEEELIKAIREGHTNYPAANGMQGLREELARFIQKNQGLSYSPDEFLVAGGARPLIHAVYQALVDPGDKVVFPVPSWNNNHYTHMAHAERVMIETSPESNFMPTAAQLKEHLNDARMLALCSPLNPTGTVFSKEQLEAICEVVLEINKERGENDPLYVLYDQIYWMLCYGETAHVDPVSLFEEMRPYTIFIDGLSKAFAATGVRVGWSFGPPHIIAKMRAILGHIGAWSPKAEQMATERYLKQEDQVEAYLTDIKERLSMRLNGFYQGFQAMKADGYPVDAIKPQGAIYLAVKIDLKGFEYDGAVMNSTKEVASFLINEVGLAIVPFYAFGASETSVWFRLSVGTASEASIAEVFEALRTKLSPVNV
ncbi:MAG: aminotransferase class I/II-fold pyridoxal phosphate-dependent enzyme [Flavobacteriales bacterium]|nr:aminotransferase class I/II-fold pyridoxal phosphate-dependent enzyme [Flavobacteriales bacterium]